MLRHSDHFINTWSFISLSERYNKNTFASFKNVNLNFSKILWIHRFHNNRINHCLQVYHTPVAHLQCTYLKT